MRSIWRAALVLTTALALGGCGSGVEAVQNPLSGETDSCTGPGMSDWSPWSQRDACLADHIAQGWTVKMKSPE